MESGIRTIKEKEPLETTSTDKSHYIASIAKKTKLDDMYLSIIRTVNETIKPFVLSNTKSKEFTYKGETKNIELRKPGICYIDDNGKGYIFYTDNLVRSAQKTLFHRKNCSGQSLITKTIKRKELKKNLYDIGNNDQHYVGKVDKCDSFDVWEVLETFETSNFIDIWSECPDCGRTSINNISYEISSSRDNFFIFEKEISVLETKYLNPKNGITFESEKKNDPDKDKIHMTLGERKKKELKYKNHNNDFFTDDIFKSKRKFALHSLDRGRGFKVFLNNVMKLTHKWEALVTDIDREKGKMAVRLADLIKLDNPRQTVIMPLNIIPGEEENNLRVGAIFYLSIGEPERWKKKEPKTVIVFKKQPPLNAALKQLYKEEADQLYKEINWE